MVKFWNIIHYFVYKVDYKLHLLFNKINPFTLIHKFPFQKRIYAQKGIDINNELNKAFKRPDIGISSIRAGGFMYILVFLFCFGIVNLCSAVIQKELNLQLYHFIALIIVSFIVNHFLLFKRDKYLGYFKEFEKMEKKEKKKWAWISLGVILIILLFSIGSFAFLNYQL